MEDETRQQLVEELTAARKLVTSLERETSYRAIFDSASDAMFVHDARTGAILDVNEKAQEIYGYTTEEMRHLSVQDISAGVEPYTVREAREHLIRAAAGHTEVFEWLAKNRHGQLFWVEISLKLITIANQSILIGVARDISRRKTAEAQKEEAVQALRRSEEKFRRLVETINDWVWEIDERWRYTYASPRIFDLIGYPPSEVLGKTPFDLMPKAEARRIREAFEAIARQCRPFTLLANTLVHKDGHKVVVETSGIPLIDENNVLRGYRGVDRDITSRVKAEEALAVSEQTLRGFFDYSDYGISIADPQGIITEWNRAQETITGLRASEAIGKPIWDVEFGMISTGTQAPPSYEENKARFQALLQQSGAGAETRFREFSIMRPDGTTRIVQHLVFPIRSKRGTLYGSITRDVTDVAELNLLKQQFVSVAAHELKTPVAIVKGYAQALIRDPQACPPRHMQMLQAIHRGADRVDQIVRDLLDISRLQAGQFELFLEPLDLGNMAESIVNRLAPTFDKHTLTITRPPSPVEVLGDPLRLNQVLVHLIENAIKYSPQGGPVDVSVSVEHDRAIVSVADRGIGIPRRKQGSIFQRFYRAHTGTPFDYGGLGVGLYIAHEIVERHGGHMWFASREGKGSTFSFSLPLRGHNAAP